MADAHTHSHNHGSPKSFWKRIDKAWVATPVILALVAIFLPSELGYAVGFTIENIAKTGVFISFAVLMVAYLRATGAESIVASAFKGNELRMIVLAAMVG